MDLLFEEEQSNEGEEEESNTGKVQADGELLPTIRGSDGHSYTRDGPT